VADGPSLSMIRMEVDGGGAPHMTVVTTKSDNSRYDENEYQRIKKNEFESLQNDMLQIEDLSEQIVPYDNRYCA